MDTFKKSLEKYFAKLMICLLITLVVIFCIDIPILVERADHAHESYSKCGSLAKYGLPTKHNLTITPHFITSSDTSHFPFWVLEHLKPEMMKAEQSAKRKSMPKHIYKGSIKKGYDRGHLAAAANYYYSQEATDATFIQSNIVLQHRKINRGIWKKLETHSRKFANYSDVHITSGPLFKPGEKIEYSGESKIPTDLFKVILSERNDGLFDIESYIIPNGLDNAKYPNNEYSANIEDFLVSKTEIEKLIGILIFPKADFFRHIYILKSILKLLLGKISMTADHLDVPSSPMPSSSF